MTALPLSHSTRIRPFEPNAGPISFESATMRPWLCSTRYHPRTPETHPCAPFHLAGTRPTSCLLSPDSSACYRPG
jgi:hypothetical protein